MLANAWSRCAEEAGVLNIIGFEITAEEEQGNSTYKIAV